MFAFCKAGRAQIVSNTHKGYYTNYGYLGFSAEAGKYILYATETEYLECEEEAADEDS